MNFCTQSLGTTISTDQAEEDGYPVSNLLEHTNELSSSLFLSSSSSRTNGANGFMTARFVRTPVKIRLEFQVPIEISHIVLCPTVSKQTSSGFQIETVITGKAKVPGEKYSLSTHTVAREFINSTVPNVLVFKNPRFNLKPQYHSMPLRQFELYRNFPQAFGLRHTSFFACEKVKSLEITILKVCGSSIPSIGSLQVWGQPSVYCTKSERDALVKTWVDLISAQKRSLLCKRRGDNTEDTNPMHETKRLKFADTEEDDQSEIPEIPEEFIDPITFEIMTQPLRLPSGIAVDSSTLEKYNLEEAKWGRHPNDPFTALPFSSKNQPMPETGLRGRIDWFLSQNSNDSRFYNLPRTLGGSSRSSQPESNLVTPQDSGNSRTSLPSSHTPLANTSTQKLERVFGSTSRQFVPALAASHASSTNAAARSSMKAEEFNACIKCDIKFSESGPEAHASSRLFYASTCKHFILCRPCLLLYDKNEEQTCTACNLKWKVKDLFRFHKK